MYRHTHTRINITIYKSGPYRNDYNHVTHAKYTCHYGIGFETKQKRFTRFTPNNTITG